VLVRSCSSSAARFAPAARAAYAATKPESRTLPRCALLRVTKDGRDEHNER